MNVPSSVDRRYFSSARWADMQEDEEGREHAITMLAHVAALSQPLPQEAAAGAVGGGGGGLLGGSRGAGERDAVHGLERIATAAAGLVARHFRFCVRSPTWRRLLPQLSVQLLIELLQLAI